MVYGNSRSSQCNNFAWMYEINFHGFPLPIELAVRVSCCTFSSAQATAHSGLVVLNDCSLFSVPSITLFLDFTEYGKISRKHWWNPWCSLERCWGRVLCVVLKGCTQKLGSLVFGSQAFSELSFEILPFCISFLMNGSEFSSESIELCSVWHPHTHEG